MPAPCAAACGWAAPSHTNIQGSRHTAAQKAPCVSREQPLRGWRLQRRLTGGGNTVLHPAAAAAYMAGEGSLGAMERTLAAVLIEQGDFIPGSPAFEARLRQLSAAAAALHELSVSASMAAMLALAVQSADDWSLASVGDSSSSSSSSDSQGKADATSSSSSSSDTDASSSSGTGGGGSLPELLAKFEVFKRLCSAEPGWADALARALLASAGGGGSGGALALPLADFEAALQFTAGQLPRLSRRRFEQRHQPYSLMRYVALHPEAAAGLLSRHPRGFQAAAPWLQQQLDWGEDALAHAALSEWYPQLSGLGAAAEARQQAQRWLDWLLSLGLTRRQAGDLLAADVRLLVGPHRQLDSKQQAVQQRAAEWGLGLPLAAALSLSQPYLSAGAAERTGQLVAILQGEVGMCEAQLLHFALGGGLDGGCTASEPALDRARERLKQLLLVHGGWAPVAAALAQHPEALCMSWQGLGSLLPDDRTRAAWRAVGEMERRRQAEEEAEGS